MFFVLFFSTAFMKHQSSLGSNPVSGTLLLLEPAVVDQVHESIFRLAMNWALPTSLKTSATAGGGQDLISLAPPSSKTSSLDTPPALTEMRLGATRHTTTLCGNPGDGLPLKAELHAISSCWHLGE
ncbi:hypothetical protein PI124_g8129 [Phytophthora idaei]|nr:hypothetical protein PI125_g15669 [Phytophthora idaei]KAG3149118.1 hypothetical protein PI126_g12179 [Phytophthora idaei]KAG3247160.1 hypothetical protein PI124_g8129 [Phytophthora idaei]